MSSSTARSGAKVFVAGALGGGIDSIFTMPFDCIKTQMQADKQMGQSFVYCVKKIVDRGGVLGMYRGYLPFGTMACGKAGVRWANYKMLCDLVDHLGVDRKGSMFWNGACGAGAGIAEALVWTAPTERLKTLRNVSLSTGLAAPSYPALLREHGVLGLWVGASPTAMRSASNAAVRFAIAERVQGIFRYVTGTPTGEPLPMYAMALAGGTGGAVSTVANNPIDTVKTRMQAGFRGGFLACCKGVYAERGLRGFAAGLSARVPQIFLSQAIQFVVVDKVVAFLG